MRPCHSSRACSISSRYFVHSWGYIRTSCEMPSGRGLWQVTMMPFRPRCCATAAYSCGVPTACRHNGVCMCDSYKTDSFIVLRMAWRGQYSALQQLPRVAQIRLAFAAHHARQFAHSVIAFQQVDADTGALFVALL